jgi:predicted alpha/beta-hydrolase family hydrolase
VAASDVDTPHGPARVHVHPAKDPVAVVVLGHGANGSVDAPDLVAARNAAVSAGCAVALVEQPYKVAGRRSPAPAAQLDAAWTAVVSSLRSDGVPLVVGGRSAGARVACRTAASAGAVGVLCLAFPLHPPGRPEKTRLPELEGVTVPVLIVQGERDSFGMPPAAEGREVVVVPGTHRITAKRAVADAVAAWLPQVVS